MLSDKFIRVLISTPFLQCTQIIIITIHPTNYICSCRAHTALRLLYACKWIVCSKVHEKYVYGDVPPTCTCIHCTCTCIHQHSSTIGGFPIYGHHYTHISIHMYIHCKNVCSTTRGRIKGAARSINAILLPTVLYFPCGGNY